MSVTFHLPQGTSQFPPPLLPVPAPTAIEPFQFQLTNHRVTSDLVPQYRLLLLYESYQSLPAGDSVRLLLKPEVVTVTV